MPFDMSDWIYDKPDLHLLSMKESFKRVSSLVVLSVLLMLSSQSIAQRAITLEECLTIAHRQAPALLEAKRNYEIASESAEASSRSLRSTVDLTLTAPIYSDNTTPIYNPATGLTDLLSERVTQFGPGLIINQPIYWTGGTLTLNTSLYRRTQLTMAGASVNDYLGLGTVTLNQPIFKANELKLSQSESDMNLDLAYATYATQWASLNYTIKSLFFNLYQAEQELKIQQDEVTASHANYDLAENKYKAGLIAEVDALQLEVDLASAQTDLFDRQRQLLSAERNLQAALGLTLTGKISALLDSVPDVNVTVNPEDAVPRALKSRADMLSAHYDIERSQNTLARTSNERTINVSLSGSFGASQDVEALSLLSQNPFINRGLNLSLNIPLFDWGAHSMKLEAAESSIELSRVALIIKEQQVEQEVRSSIEQLEAAKKQVEVAKKSVTVAGKAYDLSRARFDVGKITSQDLTLAQQRLTKARFSALTAQVAERLALADLTQKTLFDYETGRKVEPE